MGRTGFKAGVCRTCGSPNRDFNPTWFAEYRKRSKLLTREVAKAMGLSTSFLGDLERGRGRWTATLATGYKNAVKGLVAVRKAARSDDKE